MKPTNWENAELEMEPEVRQALANFRQNVDTWSAAALARPRTAVPAMRVLSWRLALSASFGCLLVAGSLTALLVHRRAPQQAHRQVVPAVVEQPKAGSIASSEDDDQQVEAAARDVAAVEEMLSSQESQDEQADGNVSDDEQLLAAVDKDLKRPVPRVMEPLEQLAEDSSTE